MAAPEPYFSAAPVNRDVVAEAEALGTVALGALVVMAEAAGGVVGFVTPLGQCL